MKVPQFSPWIGEEEYAAIEECFDNNWITEGPKSKEFASKLLALTGSKYGVFAPNGTLALYLGLKALGIGSGDEVIVPDFTFIASANAVEMGGARPVFVDVNRKNFQIDISNAHKLVNKKTKAIMPVHIYGTVSNMDEVMEFAKKHNIKVIEDAAESIGVSWKGKHSGTFGDVGCFSFFADKTITTAEGAFIVTDSSEIYENLLYLRNQGRIDRGSFVHPRIGYNFRMTDIQNAIGIVQLGKLEEIKKRKDHIQKLYKKYLSGVRELKFFEVEKGADWIPFRVGILVDDSQELMKYMKLKDIETRTFFYPLHKQPCFEYLKDKDYKNNDSEFPNAIYGYEHGVCLPTFPTLTDEQVEYVCNAVKQFQGRDVFYKYYDSIFKTKDYTQETNLLFELSKRYGLGIPAMILEIGTGTGNHTRQLISSGSQVISLDIDKKMTEIAKNKLMRNGKSNNLTLLTKSVEELEENNFDLAVAMFNVVTYIPTTDKLESFVKAVYKNLNSGGLFVFDCWNGAAAIVDPPKSKETLIEEKGKTIFCQLTSETDFYNQVTTLDYNIKVKSKGKVLEEGGFSFNQTLWMPREIQSVLKKVGFEIVSTFAYMQPEKPASEKDWKIVFCAKKPEMV